MQYTLKTTIHATHPTEAISTLGDVIHLVDDVAQRFSSSSFVDDDDIPLLIDYQGEQDKNSNSPSISSFTISRDENDKEYIAPAIPRSVADPGDLVRQISDGHPFVIRASAYYHISKSYTYLLVSRINDELVHLTSNEIVFEDFFQDIPDMLSIATTHEWEWNEKQGVFQRITNKSRKLRINDAINTWNMFANHETVPF